MHLGGNRELELVTLQAARSLSGRPLAAISCSATDNPAFHIWHALSHYSYRN
jgi:hypothetical protein